MIKKLRVKFICVVMAIVMLMMAVILGLVIHFAARSMEDQNISMMRRMINSPFQMGPLGKPSGELRLPFFSVQISPLGELINAIGDSIDLTDRTYIQDIVSAALLSDSDTGELEEYDLRYLRAATPIGFTIIFSDTAEESATLQKLFFNCLLIYLAAMLVFGGISILLSRWVIKPVATAWDQQRQFVADASHELKTPLSVIMANAELMQHSENTEDDCMSYAKNILDTTYQMRSLVANMLEMARVDNGSPEVKFDCVDFSQLVSDAALSFQLLYEDKQLRLHASVQEGVFLQGSEHQLYQVMDVLLDNAMKYSAVPGTVSIDLTHTGKSCLICVSNPGEPISKEDLKNIFKRFYRVDKARAMDGSYGLGLSIAASIVEAHRGKIWAESRDGYNRFFVQLPLTRP